MRKTKAQRREIKNDSVDPLTAFYLLREFRPEGPSRINIFDGSKKEFEVEASIQGRETVETPVGTFDTIIIKPSVISGGEQKGEILIWLSDDERRIPVKVDVKILDTRIGTISAVLVESKFSDSSKM
jgi:hypothetical protein